jgi:hypothetical protein
MFCVCIVLRDQVYSTRSQFHKVLCPLVRLGCCWYRGEIEIEKGRERYFIITNTLLPIDPSLKNLPRCTSRLGYGRPGSLQQRTRLSLCFWSMHSFFRMSLWTRSLMSSSVSIPRAFLSAIYGCFSLLLLCPLTWAIPCSFIFIISCDGQCHISRLSGNQYLLNCEPHQSIAML